MDYKPCWKHPNVQNFKRISIDGTIRFSNYTTIASNCQNIEVLEVQQIDKPANFNVAQLPKYERFKNLKRFNMEFYNDDAFEGQLLDNVLSAAQNIEILELPTYLIRNGRCLRKLMTKNPLTRLKLLSLLKVNLGDGEDSQDLSLKTLKLLTDLPRIRKLEVECSGLRRSVVQALKNYVRDNNYDVEVTDVYF